MSEQRPPWEEYQSDSKASEPTGPWNDYQPQQQPQAPAMPGKPQAPPAPSQPPSVSVAGSSASMPSAVGQQQPVQGPEPEIAGSAFVPGTESFVTKGPLMPSQKPDKQASLANAFYAKEPQKLKDWTANRQKDLQAQDEMVAKESYYNLEFGNLGEKELALVVADAKATGLAIDGLSKKYNEVVAALEDPAVKADPILEASTRAYGNSLVESINTMVGVANRNAGLAARRQAEINEGIGNKPAALAKSLLDAAGEAGAGIVKFDYEILSNDKTGKAMSIALGIPSMIRAELMSQQTPETKQAMRTAVDEMATDIREYPSKATGINKYVTPEYIKKWSDEGIVGKALITTAEMVPAVAASFLGHPEVAAMMFFGSSYDGVQQEMKGPQWDSVPEEEKHLVASIVGMASAGFSTMGASALANKLPAVNNVFFNVIKKMRPGMTSGQIRRLVDGETRSYIANVTSRAGQGFIAEGIEEGADFTFEELAKHIYEEIKVDELGRAGANALFNNSESINQFIAGLAENAEIGAIVGSGLGGSIASITSVGSGGKMDDRQFAMVEKLLANGDLEQQYKSESAQLLATGQRTQAEVDKTLDDIAEAKKIVDKIPQDIDVSDRREAFDLLRDKARLSKYEKSLVGDKIAAIDAKLMKLAGVEPKAEGEAKPAPTATQADIDAATGTSQTPQQDATQQAAEVAPQEPRAKDAGVVAVAEPAQAQGPIAIDGGDATTAVDAGSGRVVGNDTGVDSGEDSEIALDEEVVEDPDALINEVMAVSDEEMANEVLQVAKTVGKKLGHSVEVVDNDGLIEAATNAGADAQESLAEGFFIGRDSDGKSRIYINRDLFRRGVVAHEGTHAIIFSALSGNPDGQRIIANAASQAMKSSPEAREAMVKFLRFYGKAKAGKDGVIDVDGTVSDPVKANEIVAEFVTGIYNGTIKLDTATKQFLRDLYNRIMAALGISTKVEFKEDGDFVAVAKQIASAMKAGRVIGTKSNPNPLANPDLAPQPIQFSKSITNARKVQVNEKGHSLSFVKKSDIIDFAALVKEVADKKQNVWFWAADQLGRGLYADEHSGNTHFLDAGPSYALDPENRSKGVIWASGLAESTLRSSAEKADYIFIVSGSPQRSKLFNKAVLVALKDRIEARSGLSWEKFAKKVRGMTNVADIKQVLRENPSFEQLLDSGVDRKALFNKLIDQSNLKTTEISKYFRKIGLSLEVDSMRDGFYADNNFGINDVMLVLKPSTAGGRSSHGTYGTNVYGEVVGVPDIVVNGIDLLPEDQSKSRSRVSPMGASSGSLKSQIPSGIQFSKRQPDGSLNWLPRKFKVDGKEMEASHWQPAEDVAISYMEKAGLPYNPPSDYVKVDTDRAKRIADAYEAMKHDPENPEVKEAYEALANETKAQYEEVMKSGLRVEFIPSGAPDPYAASPRLATEDIRNNNHMWVFGTKDGYGSSFEAELARGSNPLLAESGLEISGQPALVNDLFRVVHDYFGHVKEGVGFRADGEENAWRMHSSMFSPKAQRALTTETRGQNSWVNFGPHGEKNRKASGSDTIYADQKTGLLPMWVSEDGRYDIDSPQDTTSKPQFSKRATPGKNLVPKNLRTNLTDDGKGNYVFFHKGPAKLKGGKIDPRYFGKGKSRDSRMTPVMNYYTKPDQSERMIKGEVTHAVPVPKWKVYPLMNDPLDLYDKAEENFRKQFGKDQAFDAVRQADFIGPLAAKAGFDMMIAGWSVYPLRAESTKSLTPDPKLTEKYAEEGVIDMTGGPVFSNASPEKIAKSLIAKGYNTKAKAREYLKEKGATRIVDKVMAEYDRLREAAAKKAEAKEESVSKPSSGPVTRKDTDGGEMKIRGVAKWFKNNWPEVFEKMAEGSVNYEVFPNKESLELAENLIEYLGEATAEQHILDDTKRIPGAVRGSMFKALRYKYYTEKKWESMVRLADAYAPRATSLGQEVQATFDPRIGLVESSIMTARIKVNQKVEQKLDKEGERKKFNRVKKEFSDVAKQTVDQVLSTRSISAKVDDASVPKQRTTTAEKVKKAWSWDKNKIVTKERKAELLKQVRGTFMSGVNPAYLELAVGYVEAGARTFAEFAEAVATDLGKKAVPYFKDAYKKAFETLKAKGIDVGDPSTDTEIDDEISRLNTKDMVDQLRGAIASNDRKTSAELIGKLQQSAKDFDAWGLYKDYAVDKLKRMADKEIADDIKVNDAVREFADGLVRNISAQMREEAAAKGMEAKEQKEKKPDIEIIGEAYRNFEKYEQVWKDTQAEFKRRLNAAEARLAKAETPEAKQKAEADIEKESVRLQKLDAYYGDLMVKPFSEAGLGRAVKKGMSDLKIKIDEVVRKHYTEYDAAKRSLQDKLIAEAGLADQEAKELADAISAEFDRIATAKKEKIIQQVLGKYSLDRAKKQTKKKDAGYETLLLSNVGALSNEEFIRAYAAARGWPTITDENIKEIERLADRVQRAKPGRPKYEATEDLLRYEANLAGVTGWDMAQSIWYANMLSGYQTQEVNFFGNLGQLMAEFMTASLRAAARGRFKDIGALREAVFFGEQRAILEAASVMKTGYSPIRGKIDIPPTLERVKFKGDFYNPVNWYKYVRRVMVAADVIFYEQLKELRAQQLAMQMARDENPSQDIRNRALEILNRNDTSVRDAQEQADLEFKEEVDQIMSSEMTAAQKKAAEKKAARDRDRRVFELVEKGRPEDIAERAASFARKATYNYTPEGTLGVFAAMLNMGRQKLPILSLIIPFVNVVANVSNEALNYTPVGGLRALAGGSIAEAFNASSLIGMKRTTPKLDGKELQDLREDLTAKMLLGLMAQTAMIMLSQPEDDDEEPILQITANGHGDWTKNRQLAESTGWQPYSFKIKGTDKWISYQYTPLSMAMSLVGHLRDAEKYRKEKIDDNFMTKYRIAAGRSASTFFDSNMVGAMRDVLGAISDTGEGWDEKLIGSLAKTGKAFVVPSLATQVSKDVQAVFDIPAKDARGDMWGVLVQDIPVARDYMRNKVNWLGEDISPEGGFMSRFLNDAKIDPISKLVADKHFTPSVPKQYGLKGYDPKEGKERMFTTEEQDYFFRRRGGLIKEYLQDELGKYKAKIDAMPKDDFEEYMRGIEEWATMEAKEDILFKDYDEKGKARKSFYEEPPKPIPPRQRAPKISF